MGTATTSVITQRLDAGVFSWCRVLPTMLISAFLHDNTRLHTTPVAGALPDQMVAVISHPKLSSPASVTASPWADLTGIG
tara:strand:- start:16050 stop:16289 length:240 start_codon:yes stop_codon:yes gene_type:complete